MSKKNTDSQKLVETSEGVVDIGAIKKKLKKQQISLHIALTAVFLAICVGFKVDQNNALANKEHIDGNIIRIGNDNGEAMGDVVVANPWRNASFSEILLFRSLFLTDSTFTEINPSLAEKYEILPDGVTYVITLREGQYWSDGETITVEDVLFSFEAFLRCTNVNSNLSATFQRIVGATAYANGEADTVTGLSLQGNTISIQLDSPYSNFALLLTQFVPLPKHILEGEDVTTFTSGHEFFLNANPVCSGAFFVDYIDENNNVILSKNPYYTDEATEIDTVMMCWDYDNEVLDYYSTTDPTKMVSYNAMKGYEEHQVEVYFYRYFIFNLAGGDEGEPNTDMHDIKVRQAIYHAIDTESLMEDIYFNKTTPVYGGSLELSQQLFEYNPTKARQLLEEANYDFDRTFTIAYYSGDTSSRIMLETIAGYLEEVGLTVELKKASAAELYAEPTYDMLLKNLSALNTEDWYNEYLSTNANLSQLMGREGEFDALIGDLTSTTDSVKYTGYMQDLVDLEQELLYKMPLFLLSDAVFINSNRLEVPEDIVFGNTRYRTDQRLDEWFVLKE
ncbi:MAG: ABC transporter substrate-binding protein [Eubacteriales bacterium]